MAPPLHRAPVMNVTTVRFTILSCLAACSLGEATLQPNGGPDPGTPDAGAGTTVDAPPGGGGAGSGSGSGSGPASPSRQLPIPPRDQWPNANGYCGEMSIQSIALYD